ncbi:MAG TPA: hypothetical protein HA277_00810 [Methanosphaera sp.]|nr:hypothetical protein [Methanosphaera sp.]
MESLKILLDFKEEEPEHTMFSSTSSLSSLEAKLSKPLPPSKEEGRSISPSQNSKIESSPALSTAEIV